MKEKYMLLAIKEAKKALDYDEVPIGAIIVKNGKVIASAFNNKETKNCAIYHAEIVAIEKATKKLKNWYLDGCEMYVTLEPCPMCAGAIINSRIDKVYFGAYDPKAGAIKSVMNMYEIKGFNHYPSYEGGILEKECGELLSTYFKKKREIKKENKRNMKEVCEFLKKAGTYYLATVENNKPKLRPFGTVHIYEDKLYIQTGKSKDVSKQIEKNPNVEICAMFQGKWIRLAGELVNDDRYEAKKALLDDYPSLKKMYDANDDNTQVLYFKNATATIYSFTDEPKVIKF